MWPSGLAQMRIGWTWFFRDAEQMQLIARIGRSFPAGERPPQIWVPGCATGEDVYTLALLFHRAGQPVSVLGSDINTEAIEHAESARYDAWALREVPADLRDRFTLAHDGRLQVGAALKSGVRFLHHSLVDPPPLPADGGGWDVILCRNVLIYFAAQQALHTVDRLGRSLSEKGWLFLGASEVLHTVPAGLHVCRLEGRYALRRHRPSPEVRPPQRTAPSAPPLPLAGESLSGVLADAGQLLHASKLPDALRRYGEALHRDPLCTEALLFTGVAHYLGGDQAAAVESLRSALYLDPALWPAAFYLALSYEKQGRQSEARREFQRVVDKSDCPLALRGGSVILGDIEAWKRDIVAIALRRSEAIDAKAAGFLECNL